MGCKLYLNKTFQVSIHPNYSTRKGSSQNNDDNILEKSHHTGKRKILYLIGVKKVTKSLPGSSVVENPPADSGDMGSIPDLDRFHIPLSN